MKLDGNDPVIMSRQYYNAMLRRFSDALALIDELRAAVSCEHLHHSKKEQHKGTECPVEKRIDDARAAMAKEQE